MTEGELNRLRTDAVIALLNDSDYDFGPYLDLAKSSELAIDAALPALMQAPVDQPYRMRDLNSPLPMTVISSNLLAGHPKVSTSPAEDWPMADEENPYGEHHPLSMKSGCCPLLHGGQHGEPEYAHHIISTIPMLKQMKNDEVGISQSLDKERYGHPIEHMHDLFQRNRAEDAFMDEGEWTERKRSELMNSFGMVPYLFGLEWNRPEQREAFVDLLAQANAATDDSARKVVLNKMQEKAGISWGRAKRSWMARFTPMAEWWMRPADRHGVVSHAGLSDHDDHYHGPWTQGGEPSMNHHWWEPFLHWGGVGRNADSLAGILQQSYPELFPEMGWAQNSLISPVIEGLAATSSHSSHFPALANSNMESVDPMTAQAVHGGMPDDFTRRRGNWSAVSNHAHLYANEVKGIAHGRMEVPSDALLMTSLGTAMMGHTDVGRPRQGIFREDHPTSTAGYWMTHNPHFQTVDRHLGDMISNTTQQVLEKFGPEVLTGTDPQSNLVARGNLQQIAAAVNHAAMRTPMGPKYKVMGGMRMGDLGPVNPASHATMPPIYVAGNNDVWGHDMPATLAWRFDPNEGLRFDVKDTPFTTLQRTMHKGHIPLPSMLDVELPPKTRDVYAMSAVNPQGLSHLVSGDLQKSDYEPTGVFKTMIEPAHTLYDLDDLDTLKGFSGDWVVQQVPPGKRMLVVKKGNRITPANLHEKVKDDLKKLSGDCTFDSYVDGKTLKAIDLLVHKGTDLHMEPLEDRINALRTLYDSTEHVHFPSPANCNSSDMDGLVKTANTMRDGELLIRDAKSTFMKGREVHPKWIRLVEKDSLKKFVPTLPQVVVRGGRLELHYPEIVDPVVVKGEMQPEGFVLSAYEGPVTLVKHARRQQELWGPLAVSLLKEGGAGGGGGAAASGGGTVTSSTPGTHSPLHSARRRRRPRKHLTRKSAVLRAPAISGDDGKPQEVEQIMSHVRRYIINQDESKTAEELCEEFDDLTPKMLEMYGPEYGVESKDGKWTVNEAIDDDIVERFIYPRMNGASPDGGAWSGMQADLTAPRGPTELTEESGTTFADGRDVDDEDEPMDAPSLNVRVDRGLMGDEATLEVEGSRAILRFPARTAEDEADEQEVEQANRSEAEQRVA